jgi:hypothetical protein
VAPVASNEHCKVVILSEAPPRIYRITDGLWREVEGPRRCVPVDALRSFPSTNSKRKFMSFGFAFPR